VPHVAVCGKATAPPPLLKESLLAELPPAYGAVDDRLVVAGQLEPQRWAVGGELAAARPCVTSVMRAV
jgi:hypothetical protein